MLSAGGVDPAGSLIILVTDGEQNIEPFVDHPTVKPAIISSGIMVDSILLSANADNVLISLAADTGDKFIHSSNTNLPAYLHLDT